MCVYRWAFLLKRCVHSGHCTIWTGRHHRESWVTVYTPCSGDCVSSQETVGPSQPQKGCFPLGRGLGRSPDTQFRLGTQWMDGSSPSHCLSDLTVPRPKEVRVPVQFYQGLTPNPKCLQETRLPVFRATTEPAGIRLSYLVLCPRPPGAASFAKWEERGPP